jgi:flagellum-specific ATP synthase
MRAYADMQELIKLGAYRTGSDPELDEAIRRIPAIETVLRQELDEPWTPANDFALLAAALDGGRMHDRAIGPPK